MAFEDFTEAAYRDVVRLARARYRALRYRDAAGAEDGVLWRHDIDVSPHRALALARIEREAGLVATYFVHTHSRFYNAFDPDVVSRLREIVTLGHAIGLHFDPHAHGLHPTQAAETAAAVRAECEALSRLAGVSAEAISFHDPDIGGWTAVDADELAGLPSAYGRPIRDRFAYCSDSNGHWRFAPLAEVLAAGHARLQVLTHPEWWVPEPMPPRARIARAIEGRASAHQREYDARMAAVGRDNIR